MRFTVYAVTLALVCNAGVVAAAAGDPFTVSNSIEMSEPADPISQGGISPDGRHYVLTLSRGDLHTGLREFSLLLFDTAEVRRFVNETTSPRPPGKLLVKLASASPRHAIEQVHWLSNSHQLMFLGRSVAAGNIGQVYQYDIRTRRLRQLTKHPDDIREFSVSSDGSTILYGAESAPDWTERNRHGYVVQGESINEVVTDDPRHASFSVRLFATHVNTGETVSIRSERELDTARTAPVSPSGKYAVTGTAVRRLPPSWSEYELAGMYRSYYESSKAGYADLSETALRNVQQWFPLKQLQLLDLTTGTLKPLIDVPVDSGAPRPEEISWSPDERSVVLSGSYLPFADSAGGEQEQRRAVRFVVEVEVESGRVSPVAPLSRPSATAGLQGLPPTVRWLGPGTLRLESRVFGPGNTESMRTEVYRKRLGQWTKDEAAEARAAPKTESPHAPLAFRTLEDINTPPQIEAVDLETGARRLLTDLNPWLRDLASSRAEVFEWMDRHGRPRRGGLMFPPNYRAGTPLPVVIQTYGFTESSFQLNSITSGFAARALAGRGMLVFQSPCPALDDDLAARYGENPVAAMCYEDVIDALVAKGLIDRNRVGLIGFSRTGMNVQYAITFSKYPFAAALIADSIQATPWSYVIKYGDNMELFDSAGPGSKLVPIIQGPFFGEGIEAWRKDSPAFHLDRIRTPVRYEHHGVGMVPTAWDTFAILKRMHRPVELVHIPWDGHNLETPFGRYTSQEGSVDWFAFWLQGKEDPHPAKVEQYRRWRVLRGQQAEQFAQSSEPASR